MQSLIGDAETKFVTYLFNLYNSVSYNNVDMEVLKKDIDDIITAQYTCTQSPHCTHMAMVPIVLLVVMYYQLLEN